MPPSPSPLSPPTADTSPLGFLSTQGSTRTPEFFRTVARLGIQAAEALEHAHGMGVVHRDIKRSNLMVESRLPSPAGGRGAGGEGLHLWITDFGLAMTQTDTNLTMTGDLLGTLRYMSPEQVEAKHGVLDHRTDVYSLGLTLYELLTLQPAFPGDDRQKLLRQVIEEDPRPPRELNQVIPRDLETIVLKATAKEPQSRYATAKALAGDLKRFLEDKPIRARRPTLLERSAKWSRRHRSIVWSAALLLLLATIGSTIGAVWVWRAKRETQREWQRAEENLGQAREAVDRFYTLVSESTLLDEPGFQPLRKELMETAVTYYEDLAKRHTDDPEVQAELALAYLRLGQASGQAGFLDQRIAGFAKGLEQVERVLRDHPEAVDLHARWGGFWHGGRAVPAQEPISDWSQAERVLQRGIRLWEDLVRQHPTVTGFQSDLSKFYYMMGAISEEDKSALFVRRALEIREKIVRENPGVPEHGCELGVACFFLALRLDDDAEAEKLLRRSIEVLQDAPNVAAYQEHRAVAYNYYGGFLASRDRLKEASEAYRQGAMIYEKLAAQFPHVSGYQHEALRYSRLANALGATDVIEGDPQTHQEALAALDGLHARHAPAVLHKAALLYHQAGEIYREGQNSAHHGKAEQAFRTAITLFERLTADFSTLRNYQRQLAQSHAKLAWIPIGRIRVRIS